MPTGMSFEREGVAGLRLGAGAGHEGLADRDADGREDVALLAVRVVQQRDVRAAVRVVLDARDLGGNAVLVALEVDDAVMLLVAAAAVARRDVAVLVAPAAALLRR